MNELVELEKKPAVKTMIAGWNQWADAGAISSALPQYLVEQTRAKKIGRIKPDGFYLFQIPGAHHLLRPIVKLKEGYREEMQQRQNEFFYAASATEAAADDALLIFRGEEPHQKEEQYAEAFFDATEALGVERVASVAGVYGPVPYDKDRDVSCVYSLPRMKEELAQYEVRFSNYKGGATISTYLADRAEPRGIEFFTLYAFVPSFDFSTRSMAMHPVAIGEDFKAWYDLMKRLKRMLDLSMDLSDLKSKSEKLVTMWDSKIEHLEQTMPHLQIKDYMEQVSADFAAKKETTDHTSGVWEDALQDIFGEDDAL
ncbi:MAG: PAC2 family protein [Chloroflexi bacterium]|nr:PAC2 family protein [Chloroflexota bacterium]